MAKPKLFLSEFSKYKPMAAFGISFFRTDEFQLQRVAFHSLLLDVRKKRVTEVACVLRAQGWRSVTRQIKNSPLIWSSYCSIVGESSCRSDTDIPNIPPENIDEPLAATKMLSSRMLRDTRRGVTRSRGLRNGRNGSMNVGMEGSIDRSE